jgi:hypothetical protein
MQITKDGYVTIRRGTVSKSMDASYRWQKERFNAGDHARAIIAKVEGR